MKRSWLGFALIVLLLGICILVSLAMVRIHGPIEENLLQAADFALEGNWDRAEHFFREAETGWTTWEHFRASVADHTPAEEIDGDFELLKVYCAARESVSFAGGCLQLARQVAAVGEAQELVWWNLL